MKNLTLFLAITTLLFSCKKEEKTLIDKKETIKTQNLSISDLPLHWFKLTTKKNKTYIFEPCEYQNESFRIYKATRNYVEENVSIYKKGDWVMIFESGNDGLYYSDLILEKKEQNYELKAKSFESNKQVTFKISNFNAKTQTANWTWINENNIKENFQMVSSKTRHNFKVVNENCDYMEDIIN